MDDMVRWLGAQLDEDERIARAAGGRGEQEWAADLSGKDPLGMPSWPAVVRYVTDGRLRGAVANLPVTNERSGDRMAHIAAHDPARVLREIDAKRRTLIRCEEALLAANSMLVHFAKQTLREMALPFKDRPGYEKATALVE